MQPHQQRVYDEKTELDTKITALSLFINSHSGIYLSLPEQERMRLSHQHRAMVAYSSILGERIAAF